MDQNEKGFMNKFIEFAARLGNQTHLSSLRDAFSTIMPLFILAGLAVMVNAVILPFITSGETLETLQVFGNAISNGTLNIASLLLAPAIANSLAKKRGLENTVSAMIVSLSTLVVVMPMTTMATDMAGEAIEVSGVLSFSNLGTSGMFAGIIVGLLSTEVFCYLTKNEKLRINLGEDVPPAVSNSFTILIPAILTISLFSLISLLLIMFIGKDLVTLIVTIIQEPLRKVNTSLPGYLFLYSLGNFLFTLGIHQTVINGPFTEPFMLQNINENSIAFLAGEEAPHILTGSFQTAFAQMGGTGATISLIIAILLFSKKKSSKELAKLALAPGIFEINEPVIFGFPIVFNLPMIIPFVGLPIIQTLIAYFATAAGFVSKTVVMVPWITPPIISGYIATAGDIRASILQVLLIALGVLIYLPFMKASEKVAEKQAKMQTDE